MFRQNNYLIELRLQGYAKRYAREMMDELVRKFHLRNALSAGGVPHITIYGPFTTDNQGRMVGTVIGVCRRYSVIPFKFQGFDHFNNPSNKVIFLDVAPSDELKQLRQDISNALRPITSSKSREDRKDKERFYFHSTIAFKNIDAQFTRIWQHLQSKREPDINQVVLRLTILRNGKILHEYDFMQRTLLSRSQALNRGVFRRTIQILKSKNVQYDSVLEQENPTHRAHEEIRSIESSPKGGFWSRIMRFFR